MVPFGQGDIFAHLDWERSSILPTFNGGDAVDGFQVHHGLLISQPSLVGCEISA